MSLIEAAKTIKIPTWATHVAVRLDGSKVEPCCWLETANDFVDEDPSTLSDGSWVGAYSKGYWEFFSRNEIEKPYVESVLR